MAPPASPRAKARARARTAKMAKTAAKHLVKVMAAAEAMIKPHKPKPRHMATGRFRNESLLHVFMNVRALVNPERNASIHTRRI